MLRPYGARIPPLPTVHERNATSPLRATHDPHGASLIACDTGRHDTTPHLQRSRPYGALCVLGSRLSIDVVPLRGTHGFRHCGRHRPTPHQTTASSEIAPLRGVLRFGVTFVYRCCAPTGHTRIPPLRAASTDTPPNHGILRDRAPTGRFAFWGHVCL